MAEHWAEELDRRIKPHREQGASIVRATAKAAKQMATEHCRKKAGS